MIAAIQGSLEARIPAMDNKDVRRKCGKVRRALFHLLLIVGGKFLLVGGEEGSIDRSIRIEDDVHEGRRSEFELCQLRKWDGI